MILFLYMAIFTRCNLAQCVCIVAMGKMGSSAQCLDHATTCCLSIMAREVKYEDNEDNRHI